MGINKDFIVKNGLRVNTDSLIVDANTGNVSVSGDLTASAFNGSLFGNADTSTTLETSRTFTIGNTGKSFDGSEDVSWSLGDIGVNDSTLTLSTSGIASGSQTWTSNQGSNATFTIDVPGTNLAMGGSGNSRTITSSTGNNVTVSTANTTNAGFMSTDDKSKLDGIETGAQVNVGTNLGQSRNSTSYTITSSTGSNTTLAAATTSNAGVMVAADKGKLDGIETGAQVNVGTNLGSSGTGGTRTITSSTGTNTSITYTAADLDAVPTSRTLTGGDGINSIGNLTSNRTISVDGTVVRTSGDQAIDGVKTFTSRSDFRGGSSNQFGDNEGLIRVAYPGDWSTESGDDHTAIRIQTNESNDSDFPYGVVGIKFATSTSPDWGPFIGATRTGGGNGDFVIKTGGSSVQERFRIADNGDATFSNTVTASSFSGPLSGNATTATTLETARTINGTSFDGSANITTANWGTSRTLTIGSTGKSVNGSGNISWSLAEIGINDSTLTLATSGIATGSQTWTSNQGSNTTFTVNVPGTNLGSSGTGGTRTITSSTGTNTSITYTAADLDAVTVSGDQTITGIKTFNGTINGTAVTQTVTDTTSDRLLKVGDFGIGVEAPEAPDLDDTIQNNIGFQIIRTGLESLNTPPGHSNVNFLQNFSRLNGTRGFQVAYDSPAVGSTKVSIRGFGTSGVLPWQELYHTGNISTIDSTTNQIFRVDNSERMRITSIGNVGIGTTSPEVLLDVVGGSSGDDTVLGTFRSNSTATGTATTIQIHNSTIADAVNGRAEIASIRTNSPSSGSTDLVFRASDGNSVDEMMRITSIGNVGIGTISPTERLHVNGKVRVSTVDNGVGDFLTKDSNGVITRRTPSQVLSDINAVSLAGDTMTGRLTIDNSSYRNHLFLQRGSNVAEINPSTGSNSGVSPELRFEGDMEGFWFDGRVAAEDGFFGDGSGITGITASQVGAVPTSRTLTGGDGISTIGNLSANRTISVDGTVVRTSGNQDISGNKTFTGRWRTESTSGNYVQADTGFGARLIWYNNTDDNEWGLFHRNNSNFEVVRNGSIRARFIENGNFLFTGTLVGGDVPWSRLTDVPDSLSNTVNLTGNQTINGDKEFNDTVSIDRLFLTDMGSNASRVGLVLQRGSAEFGVHMSRSRLHIEPFGDEGEGLIMFPNGETEFGNNAVINGLTVGNVSTGRGIETSAGLFWGSNNVGIDATDDNNIRFRNSNEDDILQLFGPARSGRFYGDLQIDGLVSGNAVTQTDTDNTPGRLMKTKDFGLGSNDLDETHNVTNDQIENIDYAGFFATNSNAQPYGHSSGISIPYRRDGSGSNQINHYLIFNTTASPQASLGTYRNGAFETQSIVTGNRIISTGDGLSGGGDLNSNRTLSVDGTVVRTSGDQTISGNKTFTGRIITDASGTTNFQQPNIGGMYLASELRFGNASSSDDFITGEYAPMIYGTRSGGAGGFGSASLVIQTGSTLSNRDMYFRVGDETRLFIENTGDVGIGTTSPSEKLHVAEGSLYVGSTSDLVTDYKKVVVESRGFAGLELIGDRSNVSGEPGGAYVFLGQDGATLDGGGVQGIFGIVQRGGEDGSGRNYSGTTNNSLLLGHRHNSSLHLGTNEQVRATITSAGRFGIGTNSPSQTFQVDSPSQIAALFSSGSSFQNTNIAVVNPSASTDHKGFRLEYNSSDGIRFQSATETGTFQSSGNAVGTAMVIRMDNGNVGIGTTSPSEALHVDGKIRIGTQATATTDAVRADRTISSGDGLSGGGNLTSNRTLSVDGSVIRTSGNQTIGGLKTFTNSIIISRNVQSLVGGYISSGRAGLLLRASDDGISNGAGIDVFHNDETTGPSGGIRMYTGNSTSLQINNNGQVIIGSTSPVSDRELTVAGDIAVNGLLVGDTPVGRGISNNVGNFWLANNVGIDALDNNNIRFRNTDENDILQLFGPARSGRFYGDLQIDGQSTTGLTTSQLGALVVSQADKDAVPSGATFSDYTLNIHGGGHDVGTGMGISFSAYSSSTDRSVTDREPGAAIIHIREGTNSFGPLAFKTRATSGGGCEERMRITRTGDVGIGTTSPERTLDVVGSSRVQGTFSLANPNNLLSQWGFAVNTSGDLTASVSADGGPPFPAFTITSDGVIDVFSSSFNTVKTNVSLQGPPQESSGDFYVGEYIGAPGVQEGQILLLCKARTAGTIFRGELVSNRSINVTTTNTSAYRSVIDYVVASNGSRRVNYTLQRLNDTVQMRFCQFRINGVDYVGLMNTSGAIGAALRFGHLRFTGSRTEEPLAFNVIDMSDLDTWSNGDSTDGVLYDELSPGDPVVDFMSKTSDFADADDRNYNFWNEAEIIDRRNAVGTVQERSESGLWLGALFERGSNSNGHYIKYADGTQICWDLRTLAHTDSGTSGSDRIASSWTFPASFSEVPATSLSIPFHNNNRFNNCSRRAVEQYGTQGDVASSNSTSLTIFFKESGDVDSNSSIDGCTVYAIGRWY